MKKPSIIKVVINTIFVLPFIIVILFYSVFSNMKYLMNRLNSGETRETVSKEISTQVANWIIGIGNHRYLLSALIWAIIIILILK